MAFHGFQAACRPNKADTYFLTVPDKPASSSSSAASAKR